MTVPRIRSAIVAVAAVLTGAVGAAPHAVAGHDDGQYVALGDSFSAGVGSAGPITDSRCYRSPYGYPPLVARKAGWQLDYQACSGATTESVLSGQLGTLSPGTDYVTIGVGGNDVGFATFMQACAFGQDQPGLCDAAVASARQQLAGLPAKLDTVYGAVKDKAPHAVVAVVGYPRLFHRRDCSPQADLTRAEMRELNTLADELSAVVHRRARAWGFTYVDVRDDFRGHAVCTPKPYVNTFIPPPGLTWDSFHPNRDGHGAYARAVVAALTDASRPSAH